MCDLEHVWNVLSWLGVRYIIPQFLGVHLRGEAPQVCLPAWSPMVCVCLSMAGRACGVYERPQERGVVFVCVCARAWGRHCTPVTLGLCGALPTA